MTSRPLSLTSFIELAAGAMSLHTEVTGDPPRVLSTAVYEGRVLKKVAIPMDAVRKAAPRADLGYVGERVHVRCEQNVRESLQELLRRGDDHTPPETVAALFMRVIDAYLRHDIATALIVLEALAALDPDARRLQSSLDRLRGEHTVDTTVVGLLPEE